MNVRARLTAATARGERALARNKAQAAMLRRAARAMGDRATAFIDGKQGDEAATVAAMRGRYLARQLATDDDA